MKVSQSQRTILYRACSTLLESTNLSLVWFYLFIYLALYTHSRPFYLYDSGQHYGRWNRRETPVCEIRGSLGAGYSSTLTTLYKRYWISTNVTFFHSRILIMVIIILKESMSEICPCCPSATGVNPRKNLSTVQKRPDSTGGRASLVRQVDPRSILRCKPTTVGRWK